MKRISITLQHQILADMINQTVATHAEYGLINEINGDQITIIPGDPAPGWARIEVISQVDDA